jgi:drug/metabolite transporter (DMT)-like permease
MENQIGSRAQGLLLVVLATTCWSTSGLFISLVVRGSGISPWGLAFWRDVSTFTCLLVIFAVFRPVASLRVRRRDLPWLAAMGAISIGLFHVMWNTAVLVNGVSVATVIQANAPIFVTVMAWLLWREPLTRRKIAAVALAGAGTALIAGVNRLGAAQVTPFGLLIALAAAFAYGGFSLFGKKLVGDYSAWTILTYIFGFGALTLLPFQLATPMPWPISLPVLGSFAGLVLLATISGFALYTTGLGRLQASVAAIVATTEVPFAAVVSYLALGERLDGGQVLGALLVVSGVVLLSVPRAALKLPGSKRQRPRHT